MSITQSGSQKILQSDTLVEDTLTLLIGKHSAAKPKKIGLEVELPFFEADTLKPIQFEGKKGISEIFNALAAKNSGWSALDVEKGKITSLQSDKGIIMLEPGGQIEYASAPEANLADLKSGLDAYMADIKNIAQEKGVDVLPYGFHPHTHIDECPFIHQRSRFLALKPVFDAEKGYAAWGQSSSVQITLDTPGGVENAFAAFKLGLMLQPLAAAMTANSPFAVGNDTGSLSIRRQNLLDLDSPLYSVPDAFFDDGYALKDWAAHTVTVPMSFIVRDGAYIAVAAKPFADMVGKPLPELAHLPADQQYLTQTDLLDHLTGIKPEMLLKPNLLLEFRAADLGQSPQEWMALGAFWTGLFYDPQSFSAAQDIVSAWSVADYKHLRAQAASQGMKTACAGTTAQEVLKQLIDLSEQGLQRIEPGAVSLLTPFKERVEKGMTPAEETLAVYHGFDGNMAKTLKAKALFAPRL